MRQLSGLDQAIKQFDSVLRSLFHQKQPLKIAAEVSKASTIEPILEKENPRPLTKDEAQHSAALMRINHCGEVCAQALYLGQALTAKDPNLTQQLYRAAQEERVHLHWCKNRISELGSKRSYLNPFFAVGSFIMGAAAGLCGDKISLGFLAETEEQVTEHLNKHLKEISGHDHKSKNIMLQMKEDEQRHATHAIELGGKALPKPIRLGMKAMSKIMTTLTRFI